MRDMISMAGIIYSYSMCFPNRKKMKELLSSGVNIVCDRYVIK